MKILAINGSPRKEESRTHMMTVPFLEGAREAGAEVETIFLQGKKIKPCLGCFNCWFKTPGQCIQKDDMAELLPKIVEADVLVYATPLYVFSMTAQMKAFMDRSVPTAEPFIVLRDGHCSHPRREKKTGGMVLISTCGFQELDNFDPLVATFKFLARVGGMNYMGSLLRPHGEVLPLLEQLIPDKTKEVYDAARRAGREAVENNTISEFTQAAVAKEILPLEGFCQAANNYFVAELEKVTGKKVAPPPIHQ